MDYKYKVSPPLVEGVRGGGSVQARTPSLALPTRGREAIRNIFMLGVLSTLCLTGCAHVSPRQKQLYARGYRDGVKEQMRAIAGEFQGGNFPYYHWTSPIVQEVRVPGHIFNGVFIPQHKELVIIKPGEWAQSPAYPIQSKEETYEHTTPDVDMDITDITPMPNGKGASRGAGARGKSKDFTSGMVGTK